MQQIIDPHDSKICFAGLRWLFATMLLGLESESSSFRA